MSRYRHGVVDGWIFGTSMTLALLVVIALVMQ